MVRWLCLDQLVCEAAEGPHVDLLRVLHAPRDLGRDPGRCSLLTHSILSLFGEEHAKAEVGQLDVSVGTTQYVIRLDVSVEHILLMHGSQALGHLVKAPAHEVLTEVALTLQYDISHGAAFHELEDDPDAALVVPDALAADQLLAVQVLDQTALVDDILTLSIVLRSRKLQGVVLLVLMVQYFIDLSERSLAQLAHYLENRGRVIPLDLASLLNDLSDFFNRSEALNLLLRFNQDGSQRHRRVLLHKLVIEESLKQRQVGLRDITPVDFAILSYRKTNLHVLRLIILVHKQKG